MRGSDEIRGSLFSYVDVEKRVRANHPLRVIRAVANDALAALSRDFDAIYSPFGRESIPPERLMRALLLQAFYSIRSERQLVASRSTGSGLALIHFPKGPLENLPSRLRGGKVDVSARDV